MDRKRGIRQLLGGAAVIGLVVAGGCSSMTANLAGEKISQGERAVMEAQGSNALLEAPDDLALAQEKLARAKAAFGKQNFEEAAGLAEQASVDADYARAKATTRKNTKTANEMKKNIESLRQEIRRMSN
jgi:hypothetical protein